MINKRSLIFGITIVVLCEPVLFSFIPAIDNIFKLIKILIYMYVCALVIKNILIGKSSKTLFRLLFFEFFLFLSTVINGESLYFWLLYSLNFISIFVLTERELRLDPKRCIKIIALVFSIFLLINLGMNIFNKPLIVNGAQYYFFGVRTRTADSAMVLFAVALIMMLVRYKTIMALFMLSIVFLSLLLFQVSTGIVGIFIFFLVYLGIRSGFLGSLFQNRRILVLLGILVVGVVIFRIQVYFEPIFQALFNKGADMSYRTYIWDSAITVITESKKSLFLGHGVTELGELVPFGSRMFQAHNQYLQVVLDGGLLSLLIFILLFKSWVKNIITYKKNRVAQMATSFLIVYSIMMITEIYGYYPQFFIILALFSNFGVFLTKESINSSK